MIRHNRLRAEDLESYTDLRHYSVSCHGFPADLSASMIVGATFQAPDTRTSYILSTTGPRLLINHVLKRLLAAEQEAAVNQIWPRFPKPTTPSRSSACKTSAIGPAAFSTPRLRPLLSAVSRPRLDLREGHCCLQDRSRAGPQSLHLDQRHPHPSCLFRNRPLLASANRPQRYRRASLRFRRAHHRLRRLPPHIPRSGLLAALLTAALFAAPPARSSWPDAPLLAAAPSPALAARPRSPAGKALGVAPSRSASFAAPHPLSLLPGSPPVSLDRPVRAFSASARPSGAVGSYRKPVTPSSTASETPPARHSTTGHPDAIASRITRPGVSVLDGIRNRSADAYAAASSSPSEYSAKYAAVPEKCLSSSRRVGPSPTIASLAPGTTASSAVRRIATSFFAESRPMCSSSGFSVSPPLSLRRISVERFEGWNPCASTARSHSANRSTPRLCRSPIVAVDVHRFASAKPCRTRISLQIAFSGNPSR